jgi:hypothetical protein
MKSRGYVIYLTILWSSAASSGFPVGPEDKDSSGVRRDQLHNSPLCDNYRGMMSDLRCG